MDWNTIIILFLVGAGVGSFAVLAGTLMRNWRAGSRGKEEADAYQSQKSREFEKCYHGCMDTEHWGPDMSGTCVARCRSFPAL